MSKSTNTLVMVFFCLLLCGMPAAASVSFTIGTDNFYLSVGDYDYFPYGYAATGSPPPRISFSGVLSDYGNWVRLPPFGDVWQPYAAEGWRPYVYGHWIYTQYGPTWQGYEPWAWLAYHYGNWIWSAEFGWVLVPGYDWHPGRVIWVEGVDTVGWMPAPPQGYDYSRGYLAQAGPDNQFTYQDDDFGRGTDDTGAYSYGGPNDDPRFRDEFYNPDYDRININLWVFIGSDHFGSDNYADSYLDRDYTRDLFQRRLVRVTSRPVDRTVMEKIVRRPIQEVPVQEKEVQTDRQPLKVVTPAGEEEKVRANANRVVHEVIAPGFAKKEKPFKGQQSQNQKALGKFFRQENAQPQVETVPSDTVIRNAEAARMNRDQRRMQIIETEKQKAAHAEQQLGARPQQDRTQHPDRTQQQPVPPRPEQKQEPGQDKLNKAPAPDQQQPGQLKPEQKQEPGQDKLNKGPAQDQPQTKNKESKKNKDKNKKKQNQDKGPQTQTQDTEEPHDPPLLTE